MFHFMIDLENTRSKGLQGAEYLSAEDNVTIFYSQTCMKLEKGKLQQIIDAGSGLHICRLQRTGKNALDFYIASRIGELFGGGYPGTVAIVSNDKGYIAVQDYWTCCTKPVRKVVLQPNIEQCIGCSDEGSERRKLIHGKLQEVNLETEYRLYGERLKAKEEAMRDWIEINGRRLIWEDFIGILDYYRYKAVIRGKGRDVRNQYNYMIYVLQELAYDYHEGSDYVLDHLEDFITRHYMKMPVERRLPEALEELFNQMQHRLRINLSEMLDECLKNSLKTYQLMQDTEKAESERAELIQSLPVRHSDIDSRDITKKVAYLMNLQKAKVGCPDYEVKEQEIHATSIWCELLILSLSMDTITNGLMKRAVEDDILSGIEVARLLNERGTVEKDYEQYCEAHLGCSLDEPTDIPIKDFLGLCERRFQEILGIKEGERKEKEEER